MVDPELQDLVPLYVAEGKRRLEQLLELAPRVAWTQAATEARRELHTLKGSSRMLKLRHVAELCHEGETLLQEPTEETPAELVELLDRIDQYLEELSRGGPVEEESGAEESPSADDDREPSAEESEAGDVPGAGSGAVEDRFLTSSPAPDPTSSLSPSPVLKSALEKRADEEALPERQEVEGDSLAEHRISAEVADQLTGAMAAIRLLTLSGLHASHRVGELAQLAEGGVTEALPRQILAMIASHLRQLATDLESGQHRLLRHAENQLGRLLDLQLQPLRPFLQNLARHARELARGLGKEIEVVLEGGEARLDRRIVDELRGAFLHLVTNAVDHGIETPEVRLEAGKPRVGHLKISATSHGDRVEIAVFDDGAGVDPAEVERVARETGLLAADAPEVAGADLLQLLFTSGFSTRRQVSEVSGRGMGLDAVASTVRRLGGDVWMRSEPGAGSRIFVEVPAARRGERILVLRHGPERLALPKTAVHQLRPADSDELVSGSAGLLLEVDGELLRVVSLAALLGDEEPPNPVLVVLSVAGAKSVLAVEGVESEEEVLIRPFTRGVPAPELFLGVALLLSGEPVAVIAPRALLSHPHLARPRRKPAAARKRLQVLLVEDSLVTREMERRMLEEEGFRVTAAADAEEALGRLGQETFDCLVTDLEMPGMDGFELTRHVRATRRLAHLPIIVVSTRDQSADRLAGLEAGADAYISKQALESHKLAGLIRRLGSGA